MEVHADRVAVDEGAVDRVLGRLRRIERLRAAGVADRSLLSELRELVCDAEAWARCEGGPRAVQAVAKLRAEAEGMR